MEKLPTIRARRPFAKKLLTAIAVMPLAACVSTTPDSVGRYTAPIGGAPVISNETPHSRGLVCVAGYNARRSAPRIAVGQIADYTGKGEADGSGRKITQGAALMAISALSKSGVRLVERFDTSVAELELKYANNKLIGGENTNDYRKILAGSIPGSDFYLVGGITEMNFNLRSTGGSADGGGIGAKDLKGSLSASAYVMNVGIDLRLVDTKTLEVVDVISYQKQIVARQVQAGIFDVLGTNVVTAGIGESALEPVQLAVRAVIERAVLEMVARLYGIGPDICNGGDPLAENGVPYQQTPYQQAPYPQENGGQTYAPPPPYERSAQPYAPNPYNQGPHNQDSYNPAPYNPGPSYPYPSYPAPLPPQSDPYYAPAPRANTQPSLPMENRNEARNDPYRWYSNSDAGKSGLRGGVQ